MNKPKRIKVLKKSIYSIITERIKFSIYYKISAFYALILAVLLFIVWIVTAAVFASVGLFDDNNGFFAIFVGILMFTFIAVIVISFIIGSFTIRKMLHPIHRIIATVNAISAGALHTRLDTKDTYNELKELAETFNAMLDRIETAYEKQNQFVADASHELRTPISVIQGYAALLQRWGKDDKTVLEESIDAIKNETDGMKVLAEKLLLLARIDGHEEIIECSAFSLDDLLEEVVRETRLMNSCHSISSDQNDNIILLGDRGFIKQVLRIFIDNSIKFTPRGGSISIKSCLVGERAILVVEDTGIGIPLEDLPRIFNRFYKCDKSRTRDSSGLGLGLYIAKQIIEKHGGWVRIESVLHQGTKITIDLPLCGQGRTSHQ
ncbi:sensor histidine kinase [Pseudalkalibacillus salsuginis]|uniref:sensor histidine kinase n=1 Tax=Pseudalkalibacillus salsuginis TaxID=2910972 RepID=UPI001F3B32CA|nr:HAMP domain-containing sensor histidine kinase [Pseudalkalibacillus salsuginis]MCF6410824.1 HAMP domain-containing histidine kinase [Pseudalkalibacillus salsuginis]